MCSGVVWDSLTSLDCVLLSNLVILPCTLGSGPILDGVGRSGGRAVPACRVCSYRSRLNMVHRLVSYPACRGALASFHDICSAQNQHSKHMHGARVVSIAMASRLALALHT